MSPDPIVLYDGRLTAQVALRHPESGQVLAWVENGRTIEPGDTYAATYEYPADGITGVRT